MTTKKAAKRLAYRVGESVVYPAHGVGVITDVEEQVVAGMSLELYVVNFERDKMTLKVPVPKATSVGMRKLADETVLEKALDTVRGRPRIKRTMWSRRAQEYEAKINSGDLISISEVVRDLYRSEAQPEPSYSERQLYEQAMDRMAREFSATRGMTSTESVSFIEGVIEASPKRKRAATGADELVEADQAAA